MTDAKPVHSLVLDAGPIIKNEPAISTLLSKAECLFTTSAIISEIKDATTRTRVATTLQPFLTLRSPSPTSVKIIADFARKTGDYNVLSKNDIEIIALTYELECERNQGDWRLRSRPGQKSLNGKPPVHSDVPEGHPVAAKDDTNSTRAGQDGTASDDTTQAASASTDSASDATGVGKDENSAGVAPHRLARLHLAEDAVEEHQGLTQQTASSEIEDEPVEVDADSDSDSDGWITPSNLKEHQAQDAGVSAEVRLEQTTLQAAVLTTDFAMQNVILQMNLNLLSSSLQRVRHLKTFVLRCHACFQVTKDMSKQFCPRCGGPTLTRVSCSTSANGEFKLHLKKNMQWNSRGDRYSIPKPMHGSSNGRNKGGGKNGWGHDLILAEDQKEYDRAVQSNRRQKEKSLMDEDYLPGILTGDRSREGGRPKVGAGRNVNSRKR